MTKRDLNPGALRFIGDVRDRDLMTALCSPSKSAGLIAERLKLKQLFHEMVTGWDLTEEKPSPQIYNIAAERLMVSPRLCVVVEDSPPGIESARAAGMRVIGLGDRDLLRDADYIVASYDEIPLEMMLKE
jgi:beta-phosphoglucomutase